MNKKWTLLKYRLSNFPIRINFVLLTLLIAIIYFWLPAPGAETTEDGSDSFAPLVMLLAKVGIISLSVLATVSLASTVISYLVYRYRRRHKIAGLTLDIRNSTEQDNALQIRPSISRSWRPLLGYVSGRLIFKDKSLSRTFVLGSTRSRKNSLRSEALYGSDTMQLPDIREYQIEGTLLYFEDMLRLIRLPVKETGGQRFYNPPLQGIAEEPGVRPLSTRDMNVRIDQMRNVEGEMLHYKQFEFGDDVRRIVWKIYGKNRELIVRQPEMRDPYASRIEMYASFHQSLKQVLPDTILGNAMLNTYKNAVWTLYRSLAERGEFELLYVPEQDVATSIDDINERVAYQIAQAQWQDDNSLEHYFDMKKGSVFCVHSLTDADALMRFLDNGGSEKFIYMAYLSDAFEQKKTNWIRKIFFFERAEDNEHTIQSSWLSSHLRKQVLKNEAVLSGVLRDHGFE